MRWPLIFFIAVSFWNMLDAGVFGFLINPPISLYYLQGLNTAANHGHASLFGVYGFLALGFSLMVLRYIRPTLKLNNRLMGIAFVALNLGLALMLFTSLLPVGIIQANASISIGLWWARSYLRMVIVTTAVYWGFNSPPRTPKACSRVLLTFQHRADITSKIGRASCRERV